MYVCVSEREPHSPFSLSFLSSVHEDEWGWYDRSYELASTCSQFWLYMLLHWFRALVEDVTQSSPSFIWVGKELLQGLCYKQTSWECCLTTPPSGQSTEQKWSLHTTYFLLGRKRRTWLGWLLVVELETQFHCETFPMKWQPKFQSIPQRMYFYYLYWCQWELRSYSLWNFAGQFLFQPLDIICFPVFPLLCTQ